MVSGEDLDLDAQRLAASQLEEGIDLAREGDKVRARAIFRRIIHNMPDNEDAWLWLAWLAETNEHRLRYLAEAQALFPQSHRIAEAIRWARQEVGASAPRSSEGPHESERLARSRATLDPTRLVTNAGQAVQRAQRRAAQALERVKEKVPVARLPRPQWERWQAFRLPALLLLVAVVAVGSVVWARHSRRDQLGGLFTAQALVLPTPNPYATPTPSVEQRVRPLWPMVEVAWDRGHWDEAIDALENIREINPRDEDARMRLAEACYHHGLELIARNELELARIELDRALRLDASSDDLQKVRRVLKLYLGGIEASIVKDWALVVQKLERLQELWPDFRDTRGTLCQACYERGILLLEDDIWEDARDLLVKAQELCQHPGVPEPLRKVQDKISPPKRIVVDLSGQTVTLYENHQPIRVFVCCTGRPTAPTVKGRYEVLDKLPMAYASKWDIYMPLWVGIYWAGGSENGIHGLPLLSNNVRIWRDRLGTPCSYGCIVLDTPDAEFLHDWAEVGDAVLIVP